MKKVNKKSTTQPAPTAGHEGKTLVIVSSTIGVVSGIIGIGVGVFWGCKYKDKQLRTRIIDLEAKALKLEEGISNL